MPACRELRVRQALKELGGESVQDCEREERCAYHLNQCGCLHGRG